MTFACCSFAICRSWDEPGGVAWCSILVAETAFGILFFSCLSITAPSEDMYLQGSGVGTRLHGGGEEVRRIIEAEVRNALDMAGGGQGRRSSDLRKIRDMIRELRRQGSGVARSTSVGSTGEGIPIGSGVARWSSRNTGDGRGVAIIGGRGGRDGKRGGGARMGRYGTMANSTSGGGGSSGSLYLVGEAHGQDSSSWSRNQLRAMEELEREFRPNL